MKLIRISPEQLQTIVRDWTAQHESVLKCHSELVIDQNYTQVIDCMGDVVVSGSEVFTTNNGVRS